MVIEIIQSAFIENITTYYGLDFLTIIFGIIGYLYITEKKAVGFLFNATAVLIAANVAIIASQWGFLIANSVQFVVATRAYIKWRREEKEILASKNA